MPIIFLGLVVLGFGAWMVYVAWQVRISNPVLSKSGIVVGVMMFVVAVLAIGSQIPWLIILP